MTGKSGEVPGKKGNFPRNNTVVLPVTILVTTIDPRPGWTDYFFRLAETVSVRADCTRRKVGAVIVDSDNRVVSTGYNGAPPGEKGCLSEGACPRGRHFKVIAADPVADSEIPYKCACGSSWPCEEFVAPGSSYDTGKGSCVAVHAESNCLLFSRTSVKGMWLYCTDEPCDGCTRLMKAAQLQGVRWPGGEYKFSG
jgi:dCMP deaminase